MAENHQEQSTQIKRIFNYDRSLLPNRHLAEVERKAISMDSAIEASGLSIGYPAWNLLYYSLLCTLSEVSEYGSGDQTEAVIVETGTNRGFSTIILAQALKDRQINGRVYTVDLNTAVVEDAKQNVSCAGLESYVEFHVEDSIQFLRKFARVKDHIDFAFIDSSHASDYVIQEFAEIYPLITACNGKVYFDNTSSGGVADALTHIRQQYGGNFLEFKNCSWRPPGNVIWQPSP
jgi:predicted O-methyltransferase YrrM